MPNVIELVTKYLPVLDEQYRTMSKSAILDTPPEFVQQCKDAKKVKIAKIYTDKLASYSRENGFVKGVATLEWEEHTFSVDRGRSLQIDMMDDVESLGLAFGRLAGTFQSDAVIPEMDAVRFGKYAVAAGIHKYVTLSTSNALSTIDDIVAEMDNEHVPEEGRILFCDPITYKYIVNDTSIERHLSVNDSVSKALNRKIYDYNGLVIIKVPNSRFYRNVTLLDGTTTGQEEGGFVGSGALNMLIVHPTAVLQISKRNIARFWAPDRALAASNGADGVNPDADAWKFDFRIYHDAWALDNKVKGIATVSAAVTSIALDKSTASVVVGATVTLVPTVLPADALQNVVWSSSDISKATVSASGVVTGVAAGSAVIKATAVDGSAIHGDCTVTVSAA